MRPVDIFRLILLGAIWGSSYLFMKIAAPVIGVSFTISARIIIATIILLTAFSITKRLPNFRQHWKSFFVLGALNMALPMALITFSVIHLNASVSATLNATTPMFTMLATSIWLKEKLSIKKVAGMVVGILGVSVLVGWVPLALTKEVYLSIIMALAGALCYGIAGVYTKVKFSKADPIRTAAGQMVSASILLLPVLLSSSSELVFSPKIIMAILVLGIVCTAAGYTLFFQLISSAGSVNTSLVTLIVPVFSLIWGVLFLGEPINVGLIAGLILIMVSLTLIIRTSR